MSGRQYYRPIEMLLALMTLSIGVAILSPVITVSESAYAPIGRFLGETGTGTVCLAVGSGWVMALIINGRWRHSPDLRGFCAVAAATLYAGFAAATIHTFLQSGVMRGFGIFFALDTVALCLACAWQSGREARRAVSD